MVQPTLVGNAERSQKIMIQQADPTTGITTGPNRSHYDGGRIPLWRRLTALFTLSSLVIVIGVVVAVTIGALALLSLFVLERAIAG